MKDGDPAAAVSENAALLQFLRQERDRGSPHSEHFRKELLCQRHLVATGPVGALQQPAAQA